MKLAKVFVIFSILLLLAVGCSSNDGSAGAAGNDANYPSKNISLVVPFGAGGAMDTIARGLSNVGEEHFDKPLVVVNREGAAGTVAAQEVAKSNADGYTAFIVSGAILTIQPHIKELGYTLDDFNVINSVVYNPLILVAKSDGPYQSLGDVIEAGKNGEVISVANPGVGTSNDIAQKALFGSLGIEALHTPFQANSESLANVLGGHIDLAAVHPGDVASYLEEGSLVPLGVFTPERYENMPDIPTIGEAVEEYGEEFVYGSHDFSSWYYMAVPKDTPEEAVNYLEEKFVQVIEDENFKDYTDKLNLSIQVYSGEEMNETLKELEETNMEILEKIDFE